MPELTAETPIRIVWTDETVYTYRRVIGYDIDDHQQLVLTVREPLDYQRIVSIPLDKVRWWGDPSKEHVAW